MAENTEKPKITTNFLTLPFPQDPQGITSELRRGALKSIRRVKGDKAKQERLMQVMRVLVEYSKVLFEAEVENKAVARENAVNASRRAAEKQRRVALERVAEVEKVLAEAKAAVPAEAVEGDAS